nr:hypothetical protein [Candidatus Desulfobia pelagia]
MNVIDRIFEESTGQTGQSNLYKAFLESKKRVNAEPRKEGTTPGDYTRNLAIGLNRFGQTIGRGIDVLGNLDPTRLITESGEGIIDRAGQGIESFYKKKEQEDYEALTPAMKKAMELKYTKDIDKTWTEAPVEKFKSLFAGEAWKSPAKMAGSLLQSAPSTITGMGTGMRITGSLLKSALVKSGKMSKGIAGMIGGWIGEGSVASVESGKEIYDMVVASPHEVLSQTEEYQRAWNTLSEEGLPDNVRDKKARELVADHAAMKSMAVIFGTIGALGAGSGYYMGKLLGGEITGGVAKKALLGAIGETFQEAPQSGFERLESNIQKKKYVNPNQDIWEGVQEGSVEGGVQGFAMGGGMAGGVAALQGKQTPGKDQTQDIETLNNLKTALHSGKITPEQILDLKKDPKNARLVPDLDKMVAEHDDISYANDTPAGQTLNAARNARLMERLARGEDIAFDSTINRFAQLLDEVIDAVPNKFDMENRGKKLVEIAKREKLTKEEFNTLQNGLNRRQRERDDEYERSKTPEQKINSVAGAASSDIATAIKNKRTVGRIEIDEDGNQSVIEEGITLDDAIAEIEYLIALNDRGRLDDKRLSSNLVMRFVGIAELANIKSSLKNGNIGDVLNRIKSNLEATTEPTPAEADTAIQGGKELSQSDINKIINDPKLSEQDKINAIWDKSDMSFEEIKKLIQDGADTAIQEGVEGEPGATESLETEAKKYKSAEEFVKSQFKKTPESGMDHRPSWEDAPPSSNLLEGDMLPRDVYSHPEYSIASGRNVKTDKSAKESWDAIQKIRNNPDAEITIYRSAPKKELRTGDWVTFSKNYAKEEGIHPVDSNKDMPVHSFKVKAKDVLFAGDDINEFGYYPKQQLTDIWNKANKTTPDVSTQAAKPTDTEIGGEKATPIFSG